MGEEQSGNQTLSRMQRLWRWLKKPLWLGVPIGIVLVILGIAAFQGVMVASNQNAFCFSCHLKMDTIVQEYKASATM